jgi:hypothetical protein
MQQDTPPTNGTGLDLDKLVATLRSTHTNTYEFAVCDPPVVSGGFACAKTLITPVHYGRSLLSFAFLTNQMD